MSVVGKAGYKETAIGWIPEVWDELSLGDIASTRKSKAVAAVGLKCIEMEHIEQETGRILGWDATGAQASVKTAFSEGDVLFGKLRPYLRKFAIAPFAGICTTEILAIYPEAAKANPSFLFYLMQGDGVFNTVNALSYGTKMPRVSWADLSAIPLPIPPLPEQEKIAAILTAVDDKLDVIARQIDATSTLKRGLMQTLFSQGVGTQDANGQWHAHTEFQQTELGEIPAGWSVQALESLADVERGKFSARPRNDPKYFENGHIPYIQTGDVAAATKYVKSGAQLLNDEGLKVSRMFPAETIFMTIAANIGDVALSLIPMACTDSVVGINAKTKTCNGIWLYYLLATSKEYFDSRATQNAQKNINLQVIRPFLVGLPPIEEQEVIAATLSTADEKLETLRNKQTHYQTLKRGLMQKLLTGEWRVKVA